MGLRSGASLAFEHPCIAAGDKRIHSAPKGKRRIESTGFGFIRCRVVFGNLRAQRNSPSGPFRGPGLCGLLPFLQHSGRGRSSFRRNRRILIRDRGFTPVSDPVGPTAFCGMASTVMASGQWLSAAVRVRFCSGASGGWVLLWMALSSWMKRMPVPFSSMWVAQEGSNEWQPPGRSSALEVLQRQPRTSPHSWPT